MSTTLTSVTSRISRVAVIDDESLSRETTAMLAVQANLTPIEVGIFFKSIGDLVTVVHKSADAAIIDHRLQPGNLEIFFGAEAAAALYKSGTPAILTTQYLDQDFDATIREFREWLPV